MTFSKKKKHFYKPGGQGSTPMQMSASKCAPDSSWIISWGRTQIWTPPNMGALHFRIRVLVTLMPHVREQRLQVSQVTQWPSRKHSTQWECASILVILRSLLIRLSFVQTWLFHVPPNARAKCWLWYYQLHKYKTNYKFWVISLVCHTKIVCLCQSFLFYSGLNCTISQLSCFVTGLKTIMAGTTTYLSRNDTPSMCNPF